MSLYYELKGINDAVNGIEGSYREFNKQVEAFREKFGEANANKFSLLEVPTCIDTSAAQIQIIESHKKNPILKKALKSSQTIEDTFLELDSDMKGIKRFLPRPKNKAYNERVSQLEELIPANYLKRKGIFALDNSLNGGLLYGGGAYVLFAGMSLWTGLNPKIGSGALKQFIIYGLPVLFGLFGGWMVQWGFRGNKHPKEYGIEAAKYVDSKIKELF